MRIEAVNIRGGEMENVLSIIGQMFAKGESAEEAFVRNKTLQGKLLAVDVNIDIILYELKARKAVGQWNNGDHNGAPVYWLIKTVTELADPRHAQQLMEMLLWDEIAIEECDRSVRDLLIKGIKRIGNKSLVPQLREYAEKVKQVNYSNRKKYLLKGGLRVYFVPSLPSWLHKLDEDDVRDAIYALENKN